MSNMWPWGIFVAIAKNDWFFFYAKNHKSLSEIMFYEDILYISDIKYIKTKFVISIMHC